MERELHHTIQQFAKVREMCIFCHTPMRVVLSNFLGLRNTGMPFLKSPIKDNKIIFTLDKTTQNEEIQASGCIDVTNNTLSFEVFNGSRQLVFRHQEEGQLILQAFLGMSPSIEIYCPNKKCKVKYTLNGDIIRCDRDRVTNTWRIRPFLLFQETFITSNLWVQNDWIHSSTNIYSLNGSFQAEPIKVALMDFKSMDKDKLINRIQTLVNFS